MIRDFARLIESPIGTLAFNVNDFYVGRSLLHYGEFSGLEANLFRQLIRPGDIVIDAGANIGAHSVLFAKLVTDAGVVLAFEPQEHAFQNLCANAFLNSSINLKTFRIALGAKPGSIHVPHMDPRRVNNFGGCKLGDQGSVIVLATIDSFELPQCSFIKIDVEGMELDVLKGAKSTIQKHHPIIYAEVSPSNLDSITQLQCFLLDYTHLYMHRPPLFNPKNPNGVLNNVFEDVASFNLLAMMNPSPIDPYLMPLADFLDLHTRAISETLPQ